MIDTHELAPETKETPHDACPSQALQPETEQVEMSISPEATVADTRPSPFRRVYVWVIKPVLDFALSATALVVLMPVMCAIALALLVANRGRVFFVQERAGLRGKTFRLLKFKTMTDATDGAGELLPDDQRQTRLGQWLRRTSLDELPQLLNVIMGQMSLVGPRPLLVEYLPHYKPCEMRRHEVRPGITGWQQVNGRNASDWKKRFREDVWYVDHVSPLVDAHIIWLTIGRVFRGSDVYAPGGKTLPKFSGTED